jgi:hypothetical protein
VFRPYKAMLLIERLYRGSDTLVAFSTLSAIAAVSRPKDPSFTYLLILMFWDLSHIAFQVMDHASHNPAHGLRKYETPLRLGRKGHRTHAGDPKKERVK